MGVETDQRGNDCGIWWENGSSRHKRRTDGRGVRFRERKEGLKTKHLPGR